MIDESDFLKTGIYRSQDGDPPPASLFLNDLKIGSSLGSVSGLAGAPATAQVAAQSVVPWVLPGRR